MTELFVISLTVFVVAGGLLGVVLTGHLQLRAYRRFVGRRVLVRCADVTYRGQLVGARRRTLVLEGVTAHDRDSTQPLDGKLLVELGQVLHVQVPS